MIWVAPDFRDKHRRALDRLNERTDTGVDFFGVKVGVAQIGEDGAEPEQLPRPIRLVNPSSPRFSTRWFVSERRSGCQVKAYLDLYDKPLTKALFDEMAAETGRWAAEAGLQLDWQRRENRRSSRIVARSEPVPLDHRPRPDRPVLHERLSQRLRRLLGQVVVAVDPVARYVVGSAPPDDVRFAVQLLEVVAQRPHYEQGRPDADGGGARRVPRRRPWWGRLSTTAWSGTRWWRTSIGRPPPAIRFLDELLDHGHVCADPLVDVARARGSRLCPYSCEIVPPHAWRKCGVVRCRASGLRRSQQRRCRAVIRALTSGRCCGSSQRGGIQAGRPSIIRQLQPRARKLWWW